MPASALDKLSRINVMYPMMFSIRAPQATVKSHCGVLEFSAPEGIVYIPPWMLSTLNVGEGDLVEIENVTLPVGRFIKIQAQSVDFLEITDPRAVLERSLRSFACLTVNDIIEINYNNHIYKVLILETRPASAISILETDLQVDFAPPLGYSEDGAVGGKSVEGNVVKREIGGGFRAFSGESKKVSGLASSTAGNAKSAGPAALKLPKGTLFFPSASANAKAASANTTTNTTPAVNTFKGTPNKLQ
jgi:ubiquitin fusion degradation protein 1